MLVGTEGGMGVCTLRVTGADGDDEGMDAEDIVEESLGTTGLGADGVTEGGIGIGGFGSSGLGAVGAAGAGGVAITMGREGIAATGEGMDFIAMGGGDAVGLVATGGLTDGKPIMVRLIGGRTVGGAEVDAAGCGVVPVRVVGRLPAGRAPGINEGRGTGWLIAGVGGVVTIAGRIAEGRAGGFIVQLVVEGDGMVPRSMVISP